MEKSANLILIGGGGHCGACIDVIETQSRYKIAGIIDIPENLGRKTLGYEVVGCDEDLESWVRKGVSVLITLGQIESPRRRMELFAKLKSLGAVFASVVSPIAHVARSAGVGEGTVIMHHALVAGGAAIGRNCIINDKALIEHDARIGDHCHVSTAAVVNGGAVVSDRTFLGSGSVVLQQVSVAADSVIGAGSLVRKPILQSGAYAGNPLRRLASA